MMEQAWPRSLLQDKRAVWLVAAIAALLILATDLPWQLDDYDQAKQAFTSFEMVKEGHWFYQRTPHERVATKPPLVGWISAGLYEITRSWDIAWRLPSLLAAAALSVLLYRAARSAYGRLAGIMALSAFTFNLLTPRLGALVRTDMPLALVIFAIGLLIWKKIQKGEGWSSRDRLWMFALLTAGMLIKGPIVYAFLLPGLVLFQWWRRKTEAGSAWPGWWPWVASLAIFILWVIGGIQFVPGFYEQVVQREFLGRFGETVHRPQPFYFYLPHLLHKFAPWSLALIALAVLNPNWERAERRNFWQRVSPDTFWLLCWSLGGLIVMSLIPSKRVDRIFPVVPPLCLLLGAQAGRLVQNEPLRKRVYQWGCAVLLFSILFSGGYATFKVVSAYRAHRDALVIFGRAVTAEAGAHHWRYEAISGSDEGMLLYLQKSHFIEPERATSEWNSGNLDALVVPANQVESYLRDLKGSAASTLRSAERKDEHGPVYILITRQ